MIAKSARCGCDRGWFSWRLPAVCRPIRLRAAFDFYGAGVALGAVHLGHPHRWRPEAFHQRQAGPITLASGSCQRENGCVGPSSPTKLIGIEEDHFGGSQAGLMLTRPTQAFLQHRRSWRKSLRSDPSNGAHASGSSGLDLVTTVPLLELSSTFWCSRGIHGRPGGAPSSAISMEAPMLSNEMRATSAQRQPPVDLTGEQRGSPAGCRRVVEQCRRCCLNSQGPTARPCDPANRLITEALLHLVAHIDAGAFHDGLPLPVGLLLMVAVSIPVCWPVAGCSASVDPGVMPRCDGCLIFLRRRYVAFKLVVHAGGMDQDAAPNRPVTMPALQHCFTGVASLDDHLHRS